MSGEPPPGESPPAEAPAAEPPRRSRWRRLALRLGAALLALGLSGAASELAVRLVWGRLLLPDEEALRRGQPLGEALRDETLLYPDELIAAAGSSRLFLPDPARGFRLAPERSLRLPVVDGDLAGPSYSLHTDALGLRGTDRPAPPPEALRLLVVGDSMTFGKGVDDEQTWCARLEPALERALGRPVRVYNAGLNSYGPQEEEATLQELIPQLQPDAVLIQVTLANDVSDSMRWGPAGPAGGPDPAASAPLVEHPLLTCLPARWSSVYRLVLWRWGRHLIRYRVMSSDAALDRAAEQIAAVARAARREGKALPVGLVLAPSVFEVEGHWACGVAGVTRLREGLSARLHQRGLSVLDPLEALRAHLKDGLYIPVDRHFSPRGHEAFAAAVLPLAVELLGPAR